MRQQITSVDVLFPLLADGGVYIVEDCHTSYWPEYAVPEDPERTFIGWVKERSTTSTPTTTLCSGSCPRPGPHR